MAGAEADEFANARLDIFRGNLPNDCSDLRVGRRLRQRARRSCQTKCQGEIENQATHDGSIVLMTRDVRLC